MKRDKYLRLALRAHKTGFTEAWQTYHLLSELHPFPPGQGQVKETRHSKGKCAFGIFYLVDFYKTLIY